MNEKIYCGSGKEFGKYGTVNISICIDDIPIQYKKQSKNGKTYINLKVQKKKETDKYGKTHYVEVDTWESNGNNQNNGTVNNNSDVKIDDIGDTDFDDLSDQINPDDVPF